jgi:CDP-diglyceride synthetase
VREWIAALLVTAAVATVSSLLFLLAIKEWLPELAPMEIYDYRGFYAGVTNGIGMLCACFTPNWRYATIVFGENIVFTILTMYSTVCPINQLSCGIALEPLQVQLASVGCLLVLRFTTSRSAPEALLLFILDSLGFLYIVGSLTVLVGFVDDDKRALYRQLLIVLLYVTWASDTGAYVTGKLLALFRYPYYHPLAAHLSKNKDYEGTLGAVLWGLAAMFGASHVLSVDGSPWTKTAFTIIGVVIGRFGDLFESLLKRAAGVKDSGTLIPGHGGVLDRIDALMFITLVFARYYALVLDDSNKQEEANLG